MQHYQKKYSIILLGCVIAIISGIVLINYIIDPYERFGNNFLGVYIMHSEREAKATRMKKHGEKYDLILLGDSRCEMIDVADIYPNNDRHFNASFGGGQVEEFYHFIEKYIETNSNKKLIIGFFSRSGS